MKKLISLIFCLLLILASITLTGQLNKTYAQVVIPVPRSVAPRTVTPPPTTGRTPATTSPSGGGSSSPTFFAPGVPDYVACNGKAGINSALGCIPVNTAHEFVGWFLRWSVGIAGGIAFLLIVAASFQIMTASGDPQKLQGGRELLTAAISGLILIIFSVFLLRLIGVTILNIPGL